MPQQIAARLNDILLSLTYKRSADDLGCVQFSEPARKALIGALVPEIQKMIAENVGKAEGISGK